MREGPFKRCVSWGQRMPEGRLLNCWKIVLRTSDVFIDA
jgi:hypothetical protein